MIEFVTLFLGLNFGTQTVDLNVGGQVARIELRLDGATVATLQAPPWQARVDFGPMAPHRLEALAFDQQGGELGRAEQNVNTPKAPAEARLMLVQGEADQLYGSLSWESLNGMPATTTDVELDGQAVAVRDDSRFPLPAVDRDAVHFLSAEVRFADRTVARAELVFGGKYGTAVAAELKATPLRAPKRTQTDLAGCFQANGTDLLLAALEEGPADVMIVRDSAAEEVLAGLGHKSASGMNPHQMSRRVPGLAGVSLSAAPVTSGDFSDPNRLRFEMRLGVDDEVRFLWPNAKTVAHPRYRRLTLIDTSEPLYARDGGLLYFLTGIAPLFEPDAGDQLLADAVAVAGLRAAATNRRRAVVLVLGSREPADLGQTRAADIRAYLEKLNVPLHVWSTEGSADTAWGRPRPIDTLAKLGKAFEDLKGDLESQRIAWLETSAGHLVTVDPARCAGVTMLR